MKVAFMGSDPIALPMLRHLLAEHTPDLKIEAVFTQPDRRAGRGMKVHANPIKTWALENAIPVHQPVKCGQEETALLKRLGIDLVLVMAYGQILPADLLEAPRLGALNFHASLLPRLRGASPIHTAVALGLKETGVSLMRVIPKLDAGPVADMERVSIGPADTSPDIHARLASACVPLIERVLPSIANASVKYADQDPDQVTYCRIITKTDRYLDFHAPADELVNRVRAFTPWPGATFVHNGIEIRILSARANDQHADATPGTLLVEDSGVRITCGQGELELLQLQRPGGKPMPTGDFIRGYPLESGTLLESRTMQPLESPKPFPYRRKRISKADGT